ncbi:MAG TPA: hypothetical protein VK706_15010 [Candidatus Sulfotelmatobacter sp.]|jgi:hypothetical protein|nr:hypothetical protein [Candidatus Sulfotelmatobacter sp.]
MGSITPRRRPTQAGPIYLIDGGNRVVYKSKPDPFGFKPAELKQAQPQLLGSGG